VIQGSIIHPQILQALATAGHFSRILVADGNYPFATHSPRTAERVYLNYSPGVVDAPTVLKPLLEVVPVQEANVIATDDGSTPDVWGIFQKMLPSGVGLTTLTRPAFFERVRSPETALVIATAEMRLFACILLTIGLRKA
jgi:L-fucose mutarotase